MKGATVLKEKELTSVRAKKTVNTSVRLVKDGSFYKVMVDKDVYKVTANELFAVQVFNAI